MTPTNCTLIQWSSLRQWPYLQTERKKNRAYGFRQIAQLHTRKKNHPEILNHQWSIRFWQHKTWPLHNASFPSSILPFIPGENSWHWNLSTTIGSVSGEASVWLLSLAWPFTWSTPNHPYPSLSTYFLYLEYFLCIFSSIQLNLKHFYNLIKIRYLECHTADLSTSI